MPYRRDQWVWWLIWLETFSCCFIWVKGRLFSGFWFSQCCRLWRIIFFIGEVSFVIIEEAFWLWAKIFMKSLSIKTFFALSLELFVGTTSLLTKTSHASLSSSLVSLLSPQLFFSSPLRLFLPISVTVPLTIFSIFTITSISLVIFFFNVIIFTSLSLAPIVCAIIWKRLVFWPLGLVIIRCP